MKLIPPSLLLPCLVIFAACASANPQRVQPNDKTALGLGETVYIAEIGAELNFAEVVEDSRCPKEVECVWPGRVRVLIEVEQAGITQDYVLTAGEMLEADTDTFKIGSVRVSLLAVDPFPVAPEPRPDIEYEIILNFSTE